MNSIKRRKIIKDLAVGIAGVSALNFYGCQKSAKSTNMASKKNQPIFFKISLAQWSLHRSIENKDIDVLDFASIARDSFDIEAVEYVNGFYADRVNNKGFWQQVKQRAEDQGVANLLIMIDDEGDLGSTSDQERITAVENHYKWIDAAHQLGCHSVRVNAFGEGSKEAVGMAMIDGLGRLCDYAKQANISVLIENHGLYSSDAQWVGEVITKVNLPNCGTLPDFGNFCLSAKWGSTQDGNCKEVYDRYQGVEEMMPFAKGVSAKSYSFDKDGNEQTIDFEKMLRVVQKFDFKGYVGIEYEGSELSEIEGIKKTKELLEKVAREIS